MRKLWNFEVCMLHMYRDIKTSDKNRCITYLDPSNIFFYKYIFISIYKGTFSWSKEKKEHPLLIPRQIIVEKWNLYQSTWSLSTTISCFKIFLRALHGESPANFNLFNVNPQIWQKNHEVHLSNCLDTNFYISGISLRGFRCRNYN